MMMMTNMATMAMKNVKWAQDTGHSNDDDDDDDGVIVNDYDDKRSHNGLEGYQNKWAQVTSTQ